MGLERRAISDLIQRQRIAALGTLHGGRPYVSMVPFAVLPDGSAFVVHVSQLAGHTQDMLQNPGVSLMVAAALMPDLSPQELPRISVPSRAVPCAPSSPRHADAKQAYLDRFPQSEPMFRFADFQLVLIEPESARFVGGFARAVTLTAEEIVETLRAAR